LRVQRNAQHAIREQQRTTPEKDVPIIIQVSEPLRVELHFEMYSPALSIHPFFARYAAECPHIVRKICHTACAHSHISQGDTIFNVGESPPKPKLYILLRGLLAYKHGSADVVRVETDQWVAEPCLYVDWTHRGTLSAAQDCGIFTLDAKEFQTIVVHFEHNTAINPMSYAKEFVDSLNMTADATDLLDPEFMIDYLGPIMQRARTGLRATFVAPSSGKTTKTIVRRSVASKGTELSSTKDSDWAIEASMQTLESLAYKEPCATLDEERTSPHTTTIAIASSTKVAPSARAEFVETEEVNYRYMWPPTNLQQARRKHVAIVDPSIVPLDEDEHFLTVPARSDRWIEETEV